jgi:hypothetical protein
MQKIVSFYFLELLSTIKHGKGSTKETELPGLISSELLLQVFDFREASKKSGYLWSSLCVERQMKIASFIIKTLQDLSTSYSDPKTFLLKRHLILTLCNTQVLKVLMDLPDDVLTLVSLVIEETRQPGQIREAYVPWIYCFIRYMTHKFGFENVYDFLKKKSPLFFELDDERLLDLLSKDMENQNWHKEISSLVLGSSEVYINSFEK